MSNNLYFQRTKFVDIDSSGEKTGDPIYGYRVHDDHYKSYENYFDTIEDLNEHIEEQGLVQIISNLEGFEDLDPDLFSNVFVDGEPHVIVMGENGVEIIQTNP